MNQMRRLVWTAALLKFSFGLACAQQAEPPLTPRERMMLDRIEQLEQRLAVVEGKAAPPAAAGTATLDPIPSPEKDSSSLPGFVSGTTLNFNFDGYYGYNFNRPL